MEAGFSGGLTEKVDTIIISYNLQQFISLDGGALPDKM